MESIFFSVVVFIYIPILLGVVARHAVANRHVNETPLSYAAFNFKTATSDQRFIYALLALIVILVPLAAYTGLINPENRAIKQVGMALVALALILSIAFAATSNAVWAGYNKHAKYINAFIALSAAINLSRATSFAEGIIAELTGLRASELPTGLAWLTIIMTPVAWLTALAIGCLIVYMVALFGAGEKSSAHKPPSSVLHQVPIKRKASREFATGYAIAFSFGILAISPISMVAALLKSAWAEQAIREQLVSSSFHIKAHKCGITGIDGAKIAYLEPGKAIVALPHETFSYTFKLIECPRNWTPPEQITKQYGSKDAGKS